VIHCHKDFTINQIVHAHIFENAQFALDYTPVVVDALPLRRPTDSTAFPIHQWMITQLHGTTFDSTHNGSFNVDEDGSGAVLARRGHAARLAKKLFLLCNRCS
jgi:hypothetical protein